MHSLSLTFTVNWVTLPFICFNHRHYHALFRIHIASNIRHVFISTSSQILHDCFCLWTLNMHRHTHHTYVHKSEINRLQNQIKSIMFYWSNTMRTAFPFDIIIIIIKIKKEKQWTIRCIQSSVNAISSLVHVQVLFAWVRDFRTFINNITWSCQLREHILSWYLNLIATSTHFDFSEAS